MAFVQFAVTDNRENYKNLASGPFFQTIQVEI
jgi:hypothetical protein